MMKHCHVICYVVVAVFLGLVVSQPDTLLSHMRKEVERLFCKSTNELSSRFLAENWCFLDSEYTMLFVSDFNCYNMQWPVAARHTLIDYIVFNRIRRRP